MVDEFRPRMTTPFDFAMKTRYALARRNEHPVLLTLRSTIVRMIGRLGAMFGRIWHAFELGHDGPRDASDAALAFEVGFREGLTRGQRDGASRRPRTERGPSIGGFESD